MSRPSLFSFALAGAALAGCKSSFGDYYENRVDPTVSSLSVESEPGNMGGQELVISGSGFGDDPEQLVVLIGNHNAKLVSISDSEVVLTTPRGPITGGSVDVLIATERGYLELSDAYTYQVTADGSSLYDGQTSFISVENLWTSCLGGMWDNPELAGAGCDTIAYVGETGLLGASEWFRSPYPRLQTSEYGWVGTTDYVSNWHFESTYDLAFAGGVDDLRTRVGKFSLKNEIFDGEVACVDPTLDSSEATIDCDESGVLEYDRSVVQFCEGQDPETGGDYRYRADWPVKHNFFQSDAENADAHFDPVTIGLDVPGASVSSQPLTLPGSIQLGYERGFNDAADWVQGKTSGCLDSNDDGQALLDEDGVELSWVPTDADLTGPGVQEVASYVHVSVTYLPLGWFGLLPGAPRASIVLPDAHNVDGDGRSHVTLPNSVLYQFPEPNFSWTNEPFNGPNGPTGGSLGNYDSAAAYMLFEVFRVTDYRITTENGPLIFTYVTGDMTFFDWQHPALQDDCGDCIDGDGDGWTDDKDPDCMDGGGDVESNATSDSTCNDGIDNNDDGLVDSEDPLCITGASGETTCSDGEDNDQDGWIDELDSECLVEGGNELGEDEPSATCSDGVDNDSDGWVDGADPACATGADFENDGFGDNACNDGVDNDGHLDVDALDPYCAEEGALAEEESPVDFGAKCSDGLDNEDDGDNYIDAFDPDCEVSSREYAEFFDDEPVIPACYDGIDNDGDGSTDAEDPSCWNSNADFEPDGFLNDEGYDNGTGCSDGVDSDADGWIDGEDPDCVARDSGTQEEVGFGDANCNDGIDNDSDGNIDSLDTKCSNGFDNSES